MDTKYYAGILDHQAQSENPVHIDCVEIMEENPAGLSQEQLVIVAHMLEFAWNRGYKKGYTAAVEE